MDDVRKEIQFLPEHLFFLGLPEAFFFLPLLAPDQPESECKYGGKP